MWFSTTSTYAKSAAPFNQPLSSREHNKTYKTIFRANPLCLTGNILNMYSCFPPSPEIRKPQQKPPQHLLPIPCCWWPCRWPWWWPWRRPRRWPGRRWPQGQWPRRGWPRCTEGGWSWAWPCRKERLVRHALTLGCTKTPTRWTPSDFFLDFTFPVIKLGWNWKICLVKLDRFPR